MAKMKNFVDETYDNQNVYLIIGRIKKIRVFIFKCYLVQ